MNMMQDEMIKECQAIYATLAEELKTLDKLHANIANAQLHLYQQELRLRHNEIAEFSLPLERSSAQLQAAISVAKGVSKRVEKLRRRNEKLYMYNTKLYKERKLANETEQ